MAANPIRLNPYWDGPVLYSPTSTAPSNEMSPRILHIRRASQHLIALHLTSMMKRVGTDEQMSSMRYTSVVANFNAKVLRKLQKAIAANPDTDLLSIFPTEYSVRLSRLKKQEAGKEFYPAFHLGWQSSKNVSV